MAGLKLRLSGAEETALPTALQPLPLLIVHHCSCNNVSFGLTSHLDHFWIFEFLELLQLNELRSRFDSSPKFSQK